MPTLVLSAVIASDLKCICRIRALRARNDDALCYCNRFVERIVIFIPDKLMQTMAFIASGTPMGTGAAPPKISELVLAVLVALCTARASPAVAMSSWHRAGWQGFAMNEVRTHVYAYVRYA